LMTAPQEYGLPLKKNLRGYWKLRVGDYRVVFHVEGEVVYVLGYATGRTSTRTYRVGKYNKNGKHIGMLSGSVGKVTFGGRNPTVTRAKTFGL
jgi:hypothetical protein